MTEQEQLESIRALILDATKDTKRWLAVKASEEERVHVRAIQGRLTDLDGIITRWMQRRSSEDAADWPETRREVLSRLDKARELRGNIVGKGLARLADHLPLELPGSQSRYITKAAAPITALSGTGGWTPRQPKPTDVPENPPVYFPPDLWPQTNVILREAQRRFPLQTQTLELCKHIIAEITLLFCEAVQAGKMKAGAVQREHGGGMEDLLRLLLICNDPGPLSSWGLSDQGYRLGKEVRKSDEWLRLGEAIAEAQRNSTKAGTNANQTEPLRAENSEKTTQIVESKSTDRRALVKAYIEEVRAKKSKRITRKDIWTKAGYQTRTEFERWQRHDSKNPNKAADETFTRILCVEKPHLK